MKSWCSRSSTVVGGNTTGDSCCLCTEVSVLTLVRTIPGGPPAWLEGHTGNPSDAFTPSLSQSSVYRSPFPSPRARCIRAQASLTAPRLQMGFAESRARGSSLVQVRAEGPLNQPESLLQGNTFGL